MHSYLVFIDRRDESKRFFGRFSERDLRYLQRPRCGRSFDLENFKAYVDCDGFISLASKPDYVNHVTLNYGELREFVCQAKRTSHGNLAARLSELLRDFACRTLTALSNRPVSPDPRYIAFVRAYKISP